MLFYTAKVCIVYKARNRKVYRRVNCVNSAHSKRRTQKLTFCWQFPLLEEGVDIKYIQNMLEEYCTTLEWRRQQIKRRYPTLGVDLTGFQIELTKTHAWVLRSMIKMLSDYISDNDNTYQLTLDWMNQEMNTKQTHSNTQTNLVFPDMSLTFADFFCGCSGLSLGFIQAGLKCVSVMDIAHETIST